MIDGNYREPGQRVYLILDKSQKRGQFSSWKSDFWKDASFSQDADGQEKVTFHGFTYKELPSNDLLREDEVLFQLPIPNDTELQNYGLCAFWTTFYPNNYEKLIYLINKYLPENKSFVYAMLPPVQENIDLLIKVLGGSQVLEVGSRDGLWGYILRNNDIDIIYTEKEDEEVLDCHFPGLETNLSDEQAVAKYPHINSLLVMYPTDFFSVDFVNDVFTGDIIYFIGEWGGAGHQYDPPLPTEWKSEILYDFGRIGYHLYFTKLIKYIRINTGD